MNIQYIQRKNSILTGKSNLEHLYNFNKFPVFMGCTDEPQKKDILAEMSFSICRDSGIIQLDKLLPLDLVYLTQHNDGTGAVWQNHYRAFAEFLSEYSPQNILEIGGANDAIARNYLNTHPKAQWTNVEPHPLFKEGNRIKIIKGWFDRSFRLNNDKIDTIVHSHVLEHIYDPVEFLSLISKFLSPGQKHIFTFPNMYQQLRSKFTNCLNFEHTLFLTEPIVEYMLENSGFKILNKKYYLEHSIFYATQKTDKKQLSPFRSQYKKNKNLFTEYVKSSNDTISELNKKLDKFKGTVYIFGAHIFSQFIINQGLHTKKLAGILDNSKLKQRKRLYGTQFKIESPEILKNKKNVAVILKAGAYQQEIKEQLSDINKSLTIWE